MTANRRRAVSSASCLLAINGGSSSIRFAVYEAARARLVLAGKVHRLESGEAILSARDASGREHPALRLAAHDHRAATTSLLDWLEAQPVFASVKAVGHRVVHGMKHSEPERITPQLLQQLRRITPYDPEHLPGEIRLIEAFRRRHPRLPQVACFDTAFHRGMPRVARLLPIPRRYEAKGVERYGFHGLSYSYLMEELGRLDPLAARGRVVLAHLGNGASLAAVRNGKSLDTSMGFTPTSGLMMSSRTGDLDPGVGRYLARTEHITAARFHKMVTSESGLLGVSGISSDVRELLAREQREPRAADAIELFCYQARKWIGSFAAALGGLDTLVFAGGIGENSPVIRERICRDLHFLGIALGRRQNFRNAGVISTPAGRVTVRVIHTDEEQMIARSVTRVLGLATSARPRSRPRE